MEFQPIIMAAGRGSRMTDLTSRIPKPLLPVGNKPMVWYAVDMLEKAGFQHIIIAVLKSVLHDMKRALEEVHTVGVQLEYFPLPDDADGDDPGTADTLRLLSDKIKTDILLVSCDLIADENMKEVIYDLADIHRLNDATVTMLLSPALQLTDSTSVPGGRAQKQVERDIIGFDRSNQRVLFLAADSDVEQVTSQLQHMKRFPYIRLNPGLLSDCHLYILKRAVLEYLSENGSLNTIKGDLLPFLIKQQLSGKELHKPKQPEQVSGGLLLDETDRDCRFDYDQLIQKMSTLGNSSRRAGKPNDRHGVICCAKILNEGLCLRSNTLLSYCEANRQVARYVNAQRAATGITASRQTVIDSLIGDGVAVGEKSVIKGSVIGEQTTIGERTKLFNCVIMDHVTIESGVSLTGCVVCSNACLLSGAELRECLVGVKQTVSGKHSGEMILEQDHMMI